MRTETIRDIRKDGIECRCDRCQSGCLARPGFFLPDQIAKVAEFLEMTPKDLFRKLLVVDWWAESPVEAFVLAPAGTNDAPGKECGTSIARCVFLDEDWRCKIHTVKPFECQQADHDDSNDFLKRRSAAIHAEWAKHQDMIEALLGRAPARGNGDG